MAAATKTSWPGVARQDEPAPATMHPVIARPVTLEIRSQIDAATGIAVGLVFGVAAWSLFALAIVGLFN